MPVLLAGTILTAAAPSLGSNLAILDRDGDGRVDPYEVLDVMLMLEREAGRAPTPDELGAFLAEERASRDQDLRDLIEDLDRDRDGRIAVAELGHEDGELAEADRDGDGLLSEAEIERYFTTGGFLLGEAEIREQLTALFDALDEDRDGALDLRGEVPDEERSEIGTYDRDGDGRVTRREARQILTADNTPVTFTVRGDTAFMSGVITSALPAKLLRLFAEHPEVATVELVTVPGSIDDEANLRAARRLHERGLATRLAHRGAVASGGTDFFLAGKTRSIGEGASIGVHSWGAGPGESGADLPRDDPLHRIYLDFYRQVGVPEAFYWFTLEAAPVERIHVMTTAEIARFGLRRDP